MKRPGSTLLLVAVGLTLGACATSKSPSFVAAKRSLRVAIRQPSTLDPQQIKDPAGILLTRQIFEPLLNFDPQTLQLREGLADKFSFERQSKIS